MINSVRQAIVDKLLVLYPGYKIYIDDVPQNFKTPSFLITLIDQDYNKRLSNKFKSLISFDVAYFSELKSDIKADCLDKQLNLFRSFDLVGTYRTLNKQATITDNVLHFTFSINYSEIIEVVSTKMQQQQTNTNL